MNYSEIPSPHRKSNHASGFSFSRKRIDVTLPFQPFHTGAYVKVKLNYRIRKRALHERRQFYFSQTNCVAVPSGDGS